MGNKFLEMVVDAVLVTVFAVLVFVSVAGCLMGYETVQEMFG